jgi:hypothetical protein
MEPIFQREQRVKQIPTGRVGKIILYDEHPTTDTRFYHVQFDGETQYAAVAESDLQAA